MKKGEEKKNQLLTIKEFEFFMKSTTSSYKDV
jgi:hypothetical protein